MVPFPQSESMPSEQPQIAEHELFEREAAGGRGLGLGLKEGFEQGGEGLIFSDLVDLARVREDQQAVR
jgi:hypothetical protein